MRRFSLVFAIAGMIFLFSSAVMAQQAGAAATSAQSSSPDQAQKPNPQDKAADQAQAPEIMDPNDPLFGIPPMPKGQVSLIGGTVRKIDRVRNRVTMKTFGKDGKNMSFTFDERTHIFRDGVETTERGIQRGDRVYIDGMLDGPRLFARNIRVVTSLKPSDAQGQILAYNPKTGVMTVRDDLSASPVAFHVTSNTQVKGGGGQGAMELVPGSLISVRFSSDKRYRDVAREIEILAVPGNTFTFAGKVRYLDMSRGTIAVENAADNKTYELQFRPGVVHDNVMVGSDVSVSALFNGRGYRAQTVAVIQARD